MAEDYFFVLPSFTPGMARVLDLGGTLHHSSYLISEAGPEADARAIATDMQAMAHDYVAAAQRQLNGQEEAAKK